MAWGEWGPAAVAMVTRLRWVAGCVVMLRHPMGEVRGDQANKALGWLGDSPQHRDGPRQGPNAAPNPKMKAHIEAYHTFSEFSCFQAVWSKIRAALYQGLPRGRGGRAQWCAKDYPSLNGDHPEKQLNGGCTRDVLIVPRLAGHKDPPPSTCSLSGHPDEGNKQRPVCSHLVGRQQEWR